MEMPEGKQRPPNADLYEAALWYLRSKAKDLPTEEVREFEGWLRSSPENASTLLRIAEVEGCVIPRRRSANVFNRAFARLRPAEPRVTSQRLALSISYYKHVQRKYLYPKIGLLVVALGSVAGWILLHDIRLLKIAAVAFACFGVMMIREAVLGFRVVNGYFGNTESEVREFVKFIVARRGDIDFTDQGGRRRPSLVPEPPAPRSSTPASSTSTEVLSE